MDKKLEARARMATDKIDVGFVSENRHDFVGFCRFFQYRQKPTQKNLETDTGVGFLSVFCRIFVDFGTRIMVFSHIFEQKFSPMYTIYSVK